MAEKKNKSKASLGCLFWIAFILLIIVLFFFNKSNISKALESSGAIELLSGGKKGTALDGTSAEPVVPQINTKEDPAAAETDAVAPTESASPAKEPKAADAPAKTDSGKAAEPKPTDVKKTAPAAASSPAKKAEPAPTPSKTTQTKQSEAQAPAPTRSATICLVAIDADGRVTRKEVKRDVVKTDSPLSEALNSLFAGATPAESGKGYRSLIPAGTRLLSAVVKDGVATINVSEEFQFNQYGIEGYLGQLAQVVFTATAFPTVSSVQFLVEGQRREYLGAEGVWIGTPLSRSSFQ